MISKSPHNIGSKLSNLLDGDMGAIMEILPECVKVVAPDGTLQYMNLAGLGLVEAKSPGDVEGSCVYNLIAPEHREAWMEKHQQVCRGERNLSWEFDIIGLDGTRRSMVTHSVPLPNPDGSFSQLAITRDITEHKRNEQALKRKSELLDDFFENASMGLHWVGPDGIILRANKAELDLLGYQPEEYIGHHIAEFHVDQPVIEDILARLGRNETLANYEARLRCKDGTIKHVLINSNVYREKGKFIHTRCFTRDLTDQKEAEASRKHAEEVLQYQLDLNQTITCNITSALLFLDTEQKATYVNPAWEKMTGYSQEEMQGQVAHYMVHHTYPDGRHFPMEECPIDQALPFYKSVRDYEAVFVHKDGHFYNVVCNAEPIFRDGKPAGTVVEVRDITEKMQAESALRESEERFRNLANDAPIFIFMAEGDAHVRFWNRTWLEFTGLSPEEALGRNWDTLIHPDDYETAMKEYWDAFNNRKPFIVENRFRGKDGNYQWILWKGTPRHLHNGEFAGFIGIGIDIDDRKKAEEALKESNDRYDRVVNGIQDGLWEWNHRTGIIYWSDTAREQFGVSKDKVITPDDFFEHIHPDDVDSIKASVSAHFEHNEPYDITFRGRNAETGEYRYYRARAKTYLDETGQPLLTSGIRTDISDIVAAEAALKESEANFRTMANSIPQLAWMTHPDGWIFWYNQRWFDYTGTTLEEMQGWSWQKVHHPDHVERVVENFKKAISVGEPWEDTFPLRSRDGEWRWFLSRALPIRDQNGAIIRWFGSNTDITEIRRAQEIEQAARIRLEQSNKDLEEFTTIVSHDLKAPLRKIMVFGDILKAKLDSEISPEVIENIERIQKSAKRMHDLIFDLLAISRVNRKGNPFREVDLNEIIAAIQEDLQVDIQQTGATLAVHPLCKLEGDATQLHQLFLNLVSNSLKYRKPDTPPVIDIRSEEKGNVCLITIQDNGMGIEKEYHEKIFDIFRRLVNEYQYPGTGVGLAIVRKIVERHNGRVWVESEPGQGSRFMVELLRKHPASAQ